jgi:hypothetical protein
MLMVFNTGNTSPFPPDPVRFVDCFAINELFVSDNEHVKTALSYLSSKNNISRQNL